MTDGHRNRGRSESGELHDDTTHGQGFGGFGGSKQPASKNIPDKNARANQGCSNDGWYQGDESNQFSYNYNGDQFKEWTKVISKSESKCPKYRKGDDFEKYLPRFDFYCDSKGIKSQDRARDLFNHLDEPSFDSAILLKIDMSNYDKVRSELMKRFGHKSGSFGRHERFVTRKRQQNETYENIWKTSKHSQRT